MKAFITWTILFCATLMDTSAETEKVQKELKALEGIWKAVSMEANGQTLPKDAMPPFTFIVQPDGKAISKSAFGNYEAKITVDLNKNPKSIDNLHKTGDQKGKKQLGVYKLEGEKWTVCMTMPGASEEDRPKDFKTEGTANAVIVFERQEED